jgi:hypothetical protein
MVGDFAAITPYGCVARREIMLCPTEQAKAMLLSSPRKTIWKKWLMGMGT